MLSSIIGDLIVKLVPKKITETIIGTVGYSFYAIMIALASIAPFIYQLIK